MIVLGLALALSLTSALPINNDRYLIKCRIENEDQRQFLIKKVENESLDLWDHEIPSGDSLLTIMGSHAQISDLTKNLNCQHAVDIRLFEKSIPSPKADPGPERDFFANYRSYAEIGAQLSKFSNAKLTIALDNAAISNERRNVTVIRMSGKTSRPTKKLWISCGQHAREWIAPAACMFMVDSLVRNYGIDKRITDLLNAYEVLVAPLVNPDGYEYSRLRDRYWRKNRRSLGNNNFGVDLNRNWANRWGVVGASRTPSSETYMGPSAESEPEVRLTGEYIKRLTGLVAGVDVHSYGQMILRNYGWTTRPSPDEAKFKPINDAIAAKMSAIDGTEYVSQRSGELYPASGSMDDWFYDAAKIMGMTFEMRDAGNYGFLLPPSQIRATGKELLEGVITLAEKLKSG